MAPMIYRFRFGRRVPPQVVEDCLLLAVLAAEGLHGAARVALEASSRMDKDLNRCVIDASMPVGQDIARIFTSILIHRIGRDVFVIEVLDPELRGKEAST